MLCLLHDVFTAASQGTICGAFEAVAAHGASTHSLTGGLPVDGDGDVLHGVALSAPYHAICYQFLAAQRKRITKLVTVVGRPCAS